jgi:site-specific DNA recombinase
MTRAVIYARISRDRDGDGAGVERQAEACTHLAQARGWELVHPALIDNDVSAYSGVHRPAFEQAMNLVRAGQVDALMVWHMDRVCRRVAELVDITRLCLETGVKIASVHGDFDLSSPVGRMFATILIAVAEYEAAHKGERQTAANVKAATNGHRWVSSPRPFGYQADHRTAEPAEKAAVVWAAQALLGGSTIASVTRQWDRLGLRPPQAPFGPVPAQAWRRNTVRKIFRNPRIAGLAAYRGEVINLAEAIGIDWEPLLPEETWRAVNSLLDAPDRKRERGVRTLLGGITRCRCGNVATGSHNGSGHAIYRCQPSTRGDREGPHATLRVEAVDHYVETVIIARLARADLADLITPPPGVDTVALSQEAAAIRRNLDELGADRALGLVSRSQMLAATQRGNARLEEIGADLAEAAGASVLGPFVEARERAAEVWEELDLARQRAVIDTLCTVTLDPAGRRAATLSAEAAQVTWRHAA